MIADLRRIVAGAVVEAVAAVTGEAIDVPAVEDPPRPEFGDLAIPAALELGRRLGRPPRQLAEELLGWLEANPTPGVSRWQIAGPGYLNAFFDRGWVLDGILDGLAGGSDGPAGGSDGPAGGADGPAGGAEGSAEAHERRAAPEPKAFALSRSVSSDGSRSAAWRQSL